MRRWSRPIDATCMDASRTSTLTPSWLFGQLVQLLLGRVAQVFTVERLLSCIRPLAGGSLPPGPDGKAAPFRLINASAVPAVLHTRFRKGRFKPCRHLRDLPAQSEVGYAGAAIRSPRLSTTHALRAILFASATVARL